MKTIILSLVALMLTIGSFAQGKSNKSAGVKELKEKGAKKELAAQLSVTDEQKEKFKAEKEDFRKKMEELKGNTGMSEDMVKAKREELIKAHKENMKSILTPEQQDKMKELKAEHKDKPHRGLGNGQGHLGNGRLEKMEEYLGLNADQSSRFKTMNEALKNDIREIRSNSALTQDQKREKIKELMQSHKTNVEAILTPEQLAKWEAKKKEFKSQKGLD